MIQPGWRKHSCVLMVGAAALALGALSLLSGCGGGGYAGDESAMGPTRATDTTAQGYVYVPVNTGSRGTGQLVVSAKQDVTKQPAKGAKVDIWFGQSKRASTRAGDDGFYKTSWLETESGTFTIKVSTPAVYDWYDVRIVPGEVQEGAEDGPTTK